MCRVFNEVARLGCKSHHNTRPSFLGPCARDRFQNIFRRFQLDLRNPALFLDLIPGLMPRAEVRYSGRADEMEDASREEDFDDSEDVDEDDDLEDREGSF